VTEEKNNNRGTTTTTMASLKRRCLEESFGREGECSNQQNQKITINQPSQEQLANKYS